MPVAGASDEITRVVLGWEGVESRPHWRGGTEFRLGKREIGHVHGDEVVDVPVPETLRRELLRSGRADPHKVLTDSVSAYLEGPGSVERAIALLRESYELHRREAADRPKRPPRGRLARIVRRLRRR